MNLGWLKAEFGTGFRSTHAETIFRGALIATVVLTLCGYVFVAFDLLPPALGWFGSIILFLSALVVALSESREAPSQRVLLELGLISAAAFALEYVGMNYGIPFGTYSYTNTLGFRLFGVPLAICAAWYVTIATTRRIAQRSDRTPFQRALLAAWLTLAFDVALEPMASRVAMYWIWQSDTVPVQNYISWFVAAFCAVYVLERTRHRFLAHTSTPTIRTAVLIFFLHLGLFIVVNISHGYMVESLIACIISGSVLLMAYRPRKIISLKPSGSYDA